MESEYKLSSSPINLLSQIVCIQFDLICRHLCARSVRPILLERRGRIRGAARARISLF